MSLAIKRAFVHPIGTGRVRAGHIFFFFFLGLLLVVFFPPLFGPACSHDGNATTLPGALHRATKTRLRFQLLDLHRLLLLLSRSFPRTHCANSRDGLFMECLGILQMVRLVVASRGFIVVRRRNEAIVLGVRLLVLADFTFVPVTALALILGRHGMVRGGRAAGREGGGGQIG